MADESHKGGKAQRNSSKGRASMLSELLKHESVLLRHGSAGASPAHLTKLLLVFFAAYVGEQSIAQDASLMLAPPMSPKQTSALTRDNSSFIYRKLPPEAEKRE